MALRRTKTRAIAASSPHDVYALTCSCGETLTGDRDTCPLILECPGCSASLYVLPRDIYPRPKVLSTDSETLEELTEDDLVPVLTIQEIEDDGKRLAEPRDDKPPRIWIDRPRGALVRKRLLQVSGLILTLLLLTWWGISRRAMRSAAEATFYAQSEAAWDFIEEAQWEEAELAAEEAAEAADFLGRDDPASEEIRDLHEELAILLKLSSASLIEIVLEKQEEELDPSNWETLFSARHGGNWLLLEGVIVRQIGDEETRYHFEYPLSLPDQHVDLVWDEPVASFEELAWKSDRFEAFLAVRMMGVRIQTGDSDSWSIVLSPDEARLWTTPALLTEALGVDLYSEEAKSLRELVESQIPADRIQSVSLEQEQTSKSNPDSATDQSAGESL